MKNFDYLQGFNDAFAIVEKKLGNIVLYATEVRTELQLESQSIENEVFKNVELQEQYES